MEWGITYQITHWLTLVKKNIHTEVQIDCYLHITHNSSLQPNAPLPLQ